MATADHVESALLAHLSHHSAVSLDQLPAICPDHTWNQLFAAVDRLSRRNAISLRRIDRHTYLITLASPQAATRTMNAATLTSSHRIAS